LQQAHALGIDMEQERAEPLTDPETAVRHRLDAFRVEIGICQPALGIGKTQPF
jgi:hypothetical protein